MATRFSGTQRESYSVLLWDNCYFNKLLIPIWVFNIYVMAMLNLFDPEGMTLLTYVGNNARFDVVKEIVCRMLGFVILFMVLIVLLIDCKYIVNIMNFIEGTHKLCLVCY